MESLYIVGCSSILLSIDLKIPYIIIYTRNVRREWGRHVCTVIYMYDRSASRLDSYVPKQSDKLLKFI